MKKGLIGLAAGAALLIAGAASAAVLAEKSAEQKHRKDVGKQVAKLVLCLTKQSEKCEKKGTSAQAECDLVNPAGSTIADAKAKQKFIDGIAKCESKLNLVKKGPASDYALFGCPGDSDAVTPGDQPFTDINDWQPTISGTARSQLSLLGTLLYTFCGGVDNQATADCVLFNIKNGSKYAKGVYNCMGKCENDYKDKKGNGGTFDDPNQCFPGNGGADPNFTTCVSSVLTKAQAKGALVAGLVAGINAALGDANNDLYNENDCP
jgi:hypothetical protein